ncbi:hypothetical protein ACMA5I_12165 [Paracoccaceae bacterium GXU_MW_L88]
MSSNYDDAILPLFNTGGTLTETLQARVHGRLAELARQRADELEGRQDKPEEELSWATGAAAKPEESGGAAVQSVTAARESETQTQLGNGSAALGLFNSAVATPNAAEEIAAAAAKPSVSVEESAEAASTASTTPEAPNTVEAKLREIDAAATAKDTQDTKSADEAQETRSARDEARETREREREERRAMAFDYHSRVQRRQSGLAGLFGYFFR